MINNSTLYFQRSFSVSSLTTGVSITLVGCLILIVTISIPLNTVLILVILSEKKLRTATNMYIINLTICDVLIATAVIPFDVDFILRGYYPYGIVLCGIKELLFLFSLPSNVLNLFLLTFKKFTSVYFPYKRAQYFSKRSVAISILLTWMYTINVSLFPIYIKGPSAISIVKKICQIKFSIEFAIFLILVNFLFPIILMAILNFLLFLKARKLNQKPQKQSSIIKRNSKITKGILILLGNTFICWISFIAIATSNLLCGGCHSRKLIWFSNVVNYANIVFNPLIYGLLSESLRKTIFKKMHKLFNGSSNMN
ncbi:histamine H2 receptor [Hydra vulgaris]|uniref:histamine H2 receptor n=1 Tax=Hydra vulgaris TaxID=6087 RepID=UPI001F5FAF4C|nr:histamine H2 receptor-like [Hydra vulgaris]